MPVYKEGRQVGRATSVTWGPTIKKMVAFGSVDKALEKPGTELSVEWTVEGERGKVGATVVADALPGPAARKRLRQRDRHSRLRRVAAAPLGR